MHKTTLTCPSSIILTQKHWLNFNFAETQGVEEAQQELLGHTGKGFSVATPLHHTWSITNTQQHQKGREQGGAQSLSVP